MSDWQWRAKLLRFARAAVGLSAPATGARTSERRVAWIAPPPLPDGQLPPRRRALSIHASVSQDANARRRVRTRRRPQSPWKLKSSASGPTQPAWTTCPPLLLGLRDHVGDEVQRLLGIGAVVEAHRRAGGVAPRGDAQQRADLRLSAAPTSLAPMTTADRTKQSVDLPPHPRSPDSSMYA